MDEIDKAKGGLLWHKKTPGGGILIEKDWKALVGNALWSWILAFIPLMVVAIKIATTSYSYDGEYTLTYNFGLISKKAINVDLRRVKSISASDSPFSGGRLVILENSGETEVFPYVKDARNIATRLRQLVDQSSRKNGEVMNRVIA